MADSYEHLAKFPTNIQITHELAVAESQARQLAEFAGLKTQALNASITASRSPNLDPLAGAPTLDKPVDPAEGEILSLLILFLLCRNLKVYHL